MLVIGISLLHYLTDQSRYHYHVFYGELYFLPIVLAGLWFGLRGALAASLGITGCYLPFIYWHWHGFSPDDFDRMLISLQSDYQVTTIKINCDPETCIERVHSRDPSKHVSFSSEIVEEVNKAVFQKDFPPDYSIENIGKSSDKLKEEIRVILYHTTNAIP